MGIRPGDEVVVPSLTFYASAEAAVNAGARPVFCDVDPDTRNVTVDTVRAVMTPNTRAILAVDLFGLPAPIPELRELGVPVLEDAAQAAGTSLGGRRAGALADAATFSFYPSKNLGAYGDGGAVVTDDDELAEAMRLMRNFGFAGFDKVIHPGTNGKMIEVCAAMGLANLGGFDGIVATNRRNHATYRQALAGIPGVSVLDYDPSERNSHHYVVVEVDEACAAGRDAILAALHAENVLARKYFWPGCHGMKPYRDLFPHAGLLLPNTRAVAERVIVLPNGTSLPEEAVATIAEVFRVLAAG
jgi:dTDP-4-amino-4,6-dideoxygalactose transaminase